MRRPYTPWNFRRSWSGWPDYAAFSASAELVAALCSRPATWTRRRRRLARTSEARTLLSVNDTISVGGAHDVRPQGGPGDARRGAGRARPAGYQAHADLRPRPGAHLRAPAGRVPAAGQDRRGPAAPAGRGGCHHAAPSRTAARCSTAPRDKLAQVRREIKIAYDRLLTRLERMVNDPHTAPMLQEGIITQRNGRYVIPLRAEFKGRIAPSSTTSRPPARPCSSSRW